MKAWAQIHVRGNRACLVFSQQAYVLYPFCFRMPYISSVFGKQSKTCGNTTGRGRVCRGGSEDEGRTCCGI